MDSFPAELPNPPFFGREPFKHTLKQAFEFGFDDLHAMNTQSGSQWDGFRHVSPRPSLLPTMDDLPQAPAHPLRDRLVLLMKDRMYGTMGSVHPLGLLHSIPSLTQRTR